MSIIIHTPLTELPKCCGECDFCVEVDWAKHHGECRARPDSPIVKYSVRDDRCPLVQIDNEPDWGREK